MSSSSAAAPKKNRPANTAFKQQRLKAWQPILTPKVVLPAFFAVGCIFIPLGVGLYLASEKVSEIIFDYTTCATGGTFDYPVTAWTYDKTSLNCTITFNIDSDMSGPVYLYYRLTNFYQNHRRYVKSFDAKQLVNQLGLSTPNANCDPLSTPFQVDLAATYPFLGSNQPASNAQIYPCGLIANSYFTDAISDLTLMNGNSKTSTVVKFASTNIAWPGDSSKFIKSTLPTDVSGNLTQTIFPPPKWVKAFPGADFSKGYTKDNFPDINKMERLQVWMRPAGLPNFKKPWGYLADSIKSGTYQMTITNNFEVASFGGTKSIVISTVSILGGKNPFLGVAYMTVGILCWVLGILFLLRQMFRPRKLGDYTYLSWNQPQRGGAPVPDTPATR
ncbi:CDC50/LEM3 family [Zopfochytrium polystomum]|nr:CDC50/LEM3 family [Zopfochytrium polystomum]